jgi:hypothetical protein
VAPRSRSERQRQTGSQTSRRTKTEAYRKLRDLKAELGLGVDASATYKVDNAVEIWLTEAMVGRAAKTVQTIAVVASRLGRDFGLGRAGTGWV